MVRIISASEVHFTPMGSEQADGFVFDRSGASFRTRRQYSRIKRRMRSLDRPPPKPVFGRSVLSRPR
jgi:hypothetical protein